MIENHDGGDEDRRETGTACCDLCGDHLTRRGARRVPLRAVDGGLETALSCGSEACGRLAAAMYTTSANRRPWGWSDDARQIFEGILR